MCSYADTARRLVRGGHRFTLKIAMNWPRSKELTIAWQRVRVAAVPSTRPPSQWH